MNALLSILCIFACVNVNRGSNFSIDTIIADSIELGKDIGRLTANIKNSNLSDEDTQKVSKTLGGVLDQFVKGGGEITDTAVNIFNNLRKKDKITGKDIAQGGVAALKTLDNVIQQNVDGKVCKRSGTGRGVGTVLENVCNSDEEAWGALCYPKCKPGYENVGCCTCRKIGCGDLTDATDIGVSCSKPAPYGRGAGYATWNFDKCEKENGAGNCEKNGLMLYPKCKSGFHAVGCCICSPDCPDGYNDDGQFCRKDHYGRGAGVSRLGCNNGKENSAALCYSKCPPNTMGLGPVCWSTCNGDTPHRCGLFCASSPATCAGATVRIVGQAATVALEVVAQDYVGAIGTALNTGKNIFSVEGCT